MRRSRAWPRSRLRTPRFARRNSRYLAESTLRVTPQAIKSIPIVGAVVQHLEQVADMHSIAEEERTALHNLAIGFLHGVRGGIQPWYMEWLLASAHNLSQVTHLDYYLEFPFDGLLYRDPAALAALDAAVRTGNIAVLRHEIDHLATRLIEVLHDPVRAQPRLAFTGPDGEHRRVVFNLKTVAGLALAAYLVTAEARHLIHPQQVTSSAIGVGPAARALGGSGRRRVRGDCAPWRGGCPSRRPDATRSQADRGAVGRSQKIERGHRERSSREFKERAS